MRIGCREEDTGGVEVGGGTTWMVEYVHLGRLLLTDRRTGSEEQQKLTLDSLLALALLPVLLLKLSDQPLVHVPGHIRTRSLLLLLCRSRAGEEKLLSQFLFQINHIKNKAYKT